MRASILKKKHSGFTFIHCITILLVLGVIVSAAAETRAAFPGIKKIQAPQVTLEEAQTFFEQHQKEMHPPAAGTFLRASTDAGIEIQELAGKLDNDPDAIYEYVYNNIEYTPIFGSLKGATGTLLDKKGNDFDQASLMISLLREAGFTANFVYGVIHLTFPELANWLDIDPAITAENVNAALSVLVMAGIPVDNPYWIGDDLFVDLNHVWVSVNIDGTDYVFDPSFKQHTSVSPIDLATAMGYNQTTFLTNAQSGATIDPDYVQNLNKANIMADLASYATNLVTEIRTNYPDAELKDIIGGRTINPVDPGSLPLRQTSLPHQQSIVAAWTEIPALYSTTLRVQHLGIDSLLYTCDIYGERVTIFYDASNQPVLRVAGSTIATGTPGTPLNYAPLNVEVNHPYLACAALDDGTCPDGTYADDTYTFYLLPEGSYLIVNGWADTSPAIVERHKSLFRQNYQVESQTRSEPELLELEPVLGESLALLGFTWLAESTRTDEIADQFSETTTIRHHMLGIAGQEEGPYVDLPLLAISTVSRTYDEASENSRFFHSGGHNSAFESGVIEQTQPYEAVSTVKLLDVANSQSKKIFEVNTTTELNNLVTALDLYNYDQSDIDSISSYLNAGYRVLLPEDGSLIVGSWTGSAYLTISGAEDSIGYIIAGILNGGYAATAATASGSHQSQTKPNSNDHAQSSEPIDLVTGDYLNNSIDLSVGSGGSPINLTFTRSYNSGAILNKNTLGLGWTHNFDIVLDIESDGFKGMGKDSPIDAAAVIAESYVTTDLLTGSKTKENLLVATLAQRWYMDQLIDNTITFRKPQTTRQFVKLADGTFNASPEDTSVLTQEPDDTYLLISKYGMQYHFDQTGILTGWSDPNGNMVNFSYSGGKLQTVSNNFDRTLTFTYSGDHIQQITDDAGRVVSYQYDANNNLIAFTNSESNTTTYEYDLPGRLTKVYFPANPSNPFMTNTYDTNSRVVTQQDPNGNIFSYEYSDGWARETDPLGNSITWQFNGNGQTVKETGPDGQVRLMTYDYYHNLTEQIFPEGDRLTYTYDDRHNVTQMTYHPKPASGESPVSIEFTYDSVFNNVQTVTDHAGRITTFSYDGQGNMTQIVLPEVDGQTPEWSFQYTPHGQLETVTDPKGSETQFVYEAGSGNLLERIRDYGGLNITEQAVYDAVGNPIQITDPRGNTTFFEYDAMRQLIRMSVPLDAPFEFSYDPDGNLLTLSIEDHVTTFTYTTSGHKKTITTPEGHVTTYTYNPLDQVWRINNAEGQVFEFLYDPSGNLIKVLDDQGQTLKEYSFTPNGKLETLTDANGNTTTFTYDDFDRFIRMTYPDSSYEEVSYDAAWNVAQKRIRDGQLVAYSYDNLYRLTAIPTQGIQYRYDLVGRLLEAEDANGIIQYIYDKVGRLLSVIYPNGKTISYEYDAAGNRTRLTYPDAYFITYNYDARNRVTQISETGTTPLAQYNYDSFGRRSQLIYGNGVSIAYSYENDDDLSSLSHTFNGNHVVLTYTYNALNKVTGSGVNDDWFVFSPQTNLSTNYTSNNLNQYTQVQGAVLSYDGNGNLSSDGGNTYTYDADNRLIAATTPQHAVSYEYDPLGRRITKQVDSDTTVYLYDDAQVLVEYTGSDQFLQRYIYGPYLDEPIGLKTATETFYYSSDGQGSVIALSDENGDIAEIFTYGPYGEGATESAIGNPYLYTGRRYDPETDLYYYRLRSYHSQLGRFFQVDPIRYLGGSLLYAYVMNDPLNWIDPCGTAKRVALQFKGKNIEAQLLNMFPNLPLFEKYNLGPYHDHVILDKAVEVLIKGKLQTIRDFGWGPKGFVYNTMEKGEDFVFLAYMPDEVVLNRLPLITEAEREYQDAGSFVPEDGRRILQKNDKCQDVNNKHFIPVEQNADVSAPKKRDCYGN